MPLRVPPEFHFRAHQGHSQHGRISPRAGVPLPSWSVNDQKVPQGRLALVSYVAAIFVVLLLVGFWKLQVVQSGHFADLAERNRVRSIPIIAPRGAMLDREGRVLVDSYPSFSILLLREDMKAIEKSIPQIID